MNDYPAGQPFLVVDLRLTLTSESGRRTPLWSGYRCPAWLDGAEPILPLDGRTVTVPMFDCAVFFEGDPIEPGGSVRARLYPLVPEFWAAIPVGRTIGLYEPLRCVARATVVEALAT